MSGGALGDLVARGTTVPLRRGPILMGVLNASSDSFSDPGTRSLQERLQVARRLAADGARMLDVGGESARTDRPPVDAADEAALVVPLVRAIKDELDVLVSVDTYKPQVAEAVLEAGADVINDISGLKDVQVARLAAEAGAALVVTHNPGTPKVRDLRADRYDDVVEEVVVYLAERRDRVAALGLTSAQTILDPGPDLAKTPAQTIAVLRDLERLQELGCPVLLAVSRKDFIGALLARRPLERLAGTLAAIDAGVRAGARILRVHDVSAVATYLEAAGLAATD